MGAVSVSNRLGKDTPPHPLPVCQVLVGWAAHASHRQCTPSSSVNSILGLSFDSGALQSCSITAHANAGDWDSSSNRHRLRVLLLLLPKPCSSMASTQVHMYIPAAARGHFTDFQPQTAHCRGLPDHCQCLRRRCDKPLQCDDLNHIPHCAHLSGHSTTKQHLPR